VLIAFALGSGCDEVKPRSFEDFMEDGLAREGVLARCKQDRDASADDVECTNARRAAIVVAAEAERVRSRGLEQESERKLEMMRDRVARAEQAAREAQLAAEAAANAAYEAQWRDGTKPAPSDSPAPKDVPAFGAPLAAPERPSGPPPGIYEDTVSATQKRPSLQVDPGAPPASEIVIDRPQVEIAEATAIPRPFRDADNTQHQ
jgi:hypothetical protein